MQGNTVTRPNAWSWLTPRARPYSQYVYRYDKGCGYFRGRIFIPSRVSYFFNSSPSSYFSDSALSVSETSRDPERPPLAIANDEHFTDNATNTSKAASSREEMILAVLEEIPGLDHDDILKAYSILVMTAVAAGSDLFWGFP